MKIAIIGTGVVGRTVGGKLAETGHDVMLGTRDVAATLARSEPDSQGSLSFAAWKEQNSEVRLGTVAEAAGFGEIVVNATPGGVSLDALKSAGAANLKGKILIDLANPLDFSHGSPPSLSVCNTDSLGEQIQREFPEAKVVKTLNTVNCGVMVDPGLVAGDHTLFLSGNDGEAKEQVRAIIVDAFGWKSENIIDLGDITSARGTEMILPLWVQLYGTFKTPLVAFQVKIGSES